MSQKLDSVIRLNSSIAKLTLASFDAKVKNASFNNLEIDEFRKKLVTKNKPLVANLPGNKKLLLASLESISDDKKIACYFLLAGDMKNGRGWGVAESSIPENIHTFIKQPFVITSNYFIEKSPYGKIYDHPSIEHLPLLGLAAPGTFDLDDESLIRRFQNKFRVGQIFDVFQGEDGIWRCLVAIDEKHRNKQLPQFVSPSLMQDDDEPEGKIKKWHGLHLTGLDQKPAYGSIAILKGECEGPLGQCAMQLKNGSMGLHLDTKIKNANQPSFVGFSSVRQIDHNTFMFANLFGPGITHKPKRMKLASCELGKILEPLKQAKIKLAALSSPDIRETQHQVIFSKKLRRLKNAIQFNESDHPRESDGKFTCKECGESISNKDKEQHETSHKDELANSLQKRGLKGDDLEFEIDKANELKNNEAQINQDGTVTVYHRTSEENKKKILESGKFIGQEDGIFFSTKKDNSQAEEFGSAVIELQIPLEKLQIDDEFGDEAHLRIPTERPNQAIDLKDYIKKNENNLDSTQKIVDSNRSISNNIHNDLDKSSISDDLQDKILNPFSRTTDPNSSYGYTEIKNAWNEAIKENSSLQKTKNQLNKFLHNG